MHSQHTLIKEPRVQALVNQQGDTIIQMKMIDAKYVLAEILDKEIVDSLINVYMERDVINRNTIELQLKIIKDYQLKSINYEEQLKNLTVMLKIKDEEIAIINKVVAEQKKEIRKQKTYKIIGVIAVIFPILLLMF